MGNQQETLGLEFVAGVAVADGCFGIYLRQIRKGYWLAEPRFIVGMKDAETMAVVADILRRHDLPIYIRETGKGVVEIRVIGIKRCKRLTEKLLPYLTGQKRRAGEAVDEYVTLRLSKPHKAPLGAEELAIIARIREINGNRGQVRLPLEILRD
jgi:hypothetical protein